MTGSSSSRSRNFTGKWAARRERSRTHGRLRTRSHRRWQGSCPKRSDNLNCCSRCPSTRPCFPAVDEWSVGASPGKIERLAHLCGLLGLPECPTDVRYQLMRRTTSALIEAERFDAKLAGMIVHSFSPEHRRYDEFARFGALLGCQIKPGRAATITVPSVARTVIPVR